MSPTMRLLGVVLTLGLCVPHGFSAQYPPLRDDPFQETFGHGLYDNGLFSPLEDLSFVTGHQYTTLTHPVFPRHSVRIKKSHEFCDPTVNSYTGYIDVGARHIFFYFFESRNDPDRDDVIFWTNGGPGCSSSLGLFMELGPCRVKDENSTVFHPESWNTNANVFFVDQPIGVGFSYAEYGESVGTTEEAAKDIATFVAIFFEHFTKFKGRAFHMAGESHGGRYIPVFATEVYDRNSRLVEAGLTPINLQSVMIGNGFTDFSTMLPSYYDMQCTPASLPPVLSISQCVDMKRSVPRCQKWLKEACVDQFDGINCAAAANFCQGQLIGPFRQKGLNSYDISSECDRRFNLHCYPITRTIERYLDQPSLRKQLGVDSSITSKFSSCDYDVGLAFVQNMDELHPTQLYVAALLERGIRALIYVGNYDLICNWIGNERWTLALEWDGQEEFKSQEMRPWMVDGKRAGLVRSANGLTFVTVEGAGHMVPYDKPKESLALVQRWLAEESI